MSGSSPRPIEIWKSWSGLESFGPTCGIASGFCGWTCPPLRERREDIPTLVQHFLKRAATRFRLPPHAVAGGEMERLEAYAWPGNVRELRNMVEEALVRCQGQDVRFDMLPGQDPWAGPSPAAVAPLPPGNLEESIRARLQSALTACHGRINGPRGAAAALGLKPSTLRSRLDRYGLPYGRRWRD